MPSIFPAILCQKPFFNEFFLCCIPNGDAFFVGVWAACGFPLRVCPDTDFRIRQDTHLLYPLGRS